MKSLKNFWDYRVLGKTPPPPRGRVDPHNVAGAGIAREKAAQAKEANRARITALGKGGVYRAATGEWEEFKDAVVKEGPPVDDKAAPPDEAQGT